MKADIIVFSLDRSLFLLFVARCDFSPSPLCVCLRKMDDEKGVWLLAVLFPARSCRPWRAHTHYTTVVHLHRVRAEKLHRSAGSLGNSCLRQEVKILVCTGGHGHTAWD